MNEKLNDTELWIGHHHDVGLGCGERDGKQAHCRRQEIVAAAVGHEPTWENFQDFWDLQRLKNEGQIVLQREADREKLRKLVFGEDAASGAPK